MLQDPLAAFRTLSETLAIIQPLLALEATATNMRPKEPIKTILERSPRECAAILHFGRMAWLREQIMIIDLGAYHKAVNVLSVADCYKLFELPTYEHNVRDLNDVLGTQSTSSPKEVVNSPEIESSVLVKSGEDTASLGDLIGVLGTPSSTGKESAQPSNSEPPSIETNAEDTASLGHPHVDI